MLYGRMYMAVVAGSVEHFIIFVYLGLYLRSMDDSPMSCSADGLGGVRTLAGVVEQVRLEGARGLWTGEEAGGSIRFEWAMGRT